MCEAVKRNNSGACLSGQFFRVTDDLIGVVRDLAPDWDNRADKKIAQTIVNGVPMFDLARPTKNGCTSRAIFHVPGGQKVTVPLVIIEDQPHPTLFLDSPKKIKQA